jgi:hypothetical protein
LPWLNRRPATGQHPCHETNFHDINFYSMSSGFGTGLPAMQKCEELKAATKDVVPTRQFASPRSGANVPISAEPPGNPSPARA